MVGRVKPATKAHKARFEKLIELGCICCRKAGIGYRRPEVHHIVEGFRRLGHEFSIPLCYDHHRGSGRLASPSIADGSKAFSAIWGTQRELLAEVNLLIGEEHG